MDKKKKKKKKETKYTNGIQSITKSEKSISPSN
jgi:hypothetical protein